MEPVATEVGLTVAVSLSATIRALTRALAPHQRVPWEAASGRVAAAAG